MEYWIQRLWLYIQGDRKIGSWRPKQLLSILAVKSRARHLHEYFPCFRVFGPLLIVVNFIHLFFALFASLWHRIVVHFLLFSIQLSAVALASNARKVCIYKLASIRLETNHLWIRTLNGIESTTCPLLIYCGMVVGGRYFWIYSSTWSFERWLSITYP